MTLYNDILPDEQDEQEDEHVIETRLEDVTQARDTAERVCREVDAAQSELSRLLVQDWPPNDFESNDDANQAQREMQSLAEYAAEVLSLVEGILERITKG